ncbi:VOC family protein [Streptomyces alboniger]|uniref:Glyoxalase/bleomycin resistance/extradiol dioxygenase family protein n=1 Tax=Streptomyces alboniger TaxID=132473 RepID=A0A5J6HDN4_STRAD|nr:VOC family protein [Streptomyces alboniger]QEV16700.1 glyoxalase/bleomycin resistance/extradiol dioxygenase family protein [Streptomyces alboniger]
MHHDNRTPPGPDATTAPGGNGRSTRTGSVLSESAVGAPCWVSLTARDLSTAQRFYGAVMGWQFRPAKLGEQFSVATAHGDPVAGVGAIASSLQIAVAWTPYFAVLSADETVSRVRERGGTTAVGPIPFPNGRAALLSDRDGAVFGIWEGEILTSWRSELHSAPAWLRLRTRDAFDAAIFYGEVLDWACGRPECCEVRYQQEEVVVYSAGRPTARLSSGAVEADPDPAVRPHWQVHFTVADVEACVRATAENGGHVVDQDLSAQPPLATLRDPDGAQFRVVAGDPGQPPV